MYFFKKNLTAIQRQHLNYFLFFFFLLKIDVRSAAKHNFNCVAMSTFEIRTHQIGRTYSGPHFFILNKGLNSGRPMPEPCPNCFVVTTSSEDLRESLFYLCLILKVGKYFSFYLKGSVIPFICITDARAVIKNALQMNEQRPGIRRF